MSLHKPPRIITISGEAASGTTSVAVELSQMLGWKRINVGEWFREYVKRINSDIAIAGELSDDIHKSFDEEQYQLLKLNMQTIIEGRLSGWLANNLNDVFRVWCFASENIRIERYSKREGITHQEARQAVLQRDQKDKEKYKNVYSVEDYRSADYYDCLIDTANITPNQAAIMICRQAGLEVFQ